MDRVWSKNTLKATIQALHGKASSAQLVHTHFWHQTFFSVLNWGASAAAVTASRREQPCWAPDKANVKASKPDWSDVAFLTKGLSQTCQPESSQGKRQYTNSAAKSSNKLLATFRRKSLWYHTNVLMGNIFDAHFLGHLHLLQNQYI